MNDRRVISVEAWRERRDDLQRTKLQQIADDLRADARRIRAELAERHPRR